MTKEKGIAHIGVGRASGENARTNSEACMIFGTVIDKGIKDRIMVTIVTAGFNRV